MKYVIQTWLFVIPRKFLLELVIREAAYQMGLISWEHRVPGLFLATMPVTYESLPDIEGLVMISIFSLLMKYATISLSLNAFLAHLLFHKWWAIVIQLFKIINLMLRLEHLH